MHNSQDRPLSPGLWMATLCSQTVTGFLLTDIPNCATPEQIPLPLSHYASGKSEASRHWRFPSLVKKIPRGLVKTAGGSLDWCIWSLLIPPSRATKHMTSAWLEFLATLWRKRSLQLVDIKKYVWRRWQGGVLSCLFPSRSPPSLPTHSPLPLPLLLTVCWRQVNGRRDRRSEGGWRSKKRWGVQVISRKNQW